MMVSKTKAIRLPIELWENLNKLRNDPKTYQNDNERRSVPTVIRKLIRDSQELRRIEQFAMSGVVPESIVPKSSQKSINSFKHASKKSPESTIILYCFNCQEQIPHAIQLRKSDNREQYKCSQCGSKRNV
jgi:hypothetical protein